MNYAQRLVNSLNIVSNLLNGASIGADQQKAHLAVGASSDIPLKIDETDLSKLKSTIQSPSGKEEPCLIKRLDDGQIGIY